MSLPRDRLRVVSVIVVLLCAGLDQKILIRHQFFHVTNLQDYRVPACLEIVQASEL